MQHNGLYLAICLLLFATNNTTAQSTGGWGNCEFATVASMNAFNPSGSNFTCKKVFVEATNEHYRWDGTQWILETDKNENIYNTSDALTADRIVSMDGNDLTFSGTNDVVIKSDGKVGINTATPSEELEINGDAKITNHLYVGPNVSTGNNMTMRIRENFDVNDNTYQIYAIPTITSPLLTSDRASYGAFIRLLNNKTEDTGTGKDSDGIAGSFRTYTSGNYTFRNLYGIQAYAYNQSTAASNLGNLYGAYMRAYNNATSGTIPNAYGGYGYVSTINGKGGDITNAIALYGRVNVDSDDGGNITTGKAGYFKTEKRGGATLMTTAYGVQVDANDAQTIYGIRVDTDDTDPNTNYGIYIDATGASSNNYGIYGERGDWILDEDGNGAAGGTGSGGDLILGESQEFELYYDGSDAQIINNSGDLNISSSTNSDVHLSINGGDVGIGTTSPAAKLDVDNGQVRFSDYGTDTYKTGNETKVLAVETDGDIVEMNTVKSSKIFYPPALSIDVSATDTDLTLDLHQNYVTVFGTPAVASSGAPAAIPSYAEDELYYYVTDYDTTIFDNVSISADGIMEYDIIAVPLTECSLINVVFVVK